MNDCCIAILLQRSQPGALETEDGEGRSEADVSEMESRRTAQVSEEDVDASSQVSEGGGMSPFP